MNRILSRVLLALIQAYRILLSPLLGPQCRYTPSCSEYTETAVKRFGPLRGAWMGLKRIARCHPWHAGGYDPVPSARDDDDRRESAGDSFEPMTRI